MVDNIVDSARQLSVSALKNLKKLINSEISGPLGPVTEFAGKFSNTYTIHTQYKRNTHSIHIQYGTNTYTIKTQYRVNTYSIQT